MHLLLVNPELTIATLVMESPNGCRKYQDGIVKNLKALINDGCITDEYGFKWKAWIEYWL